MLNFAFLFYPYNRNSETAHVELGNKLQTYICISQHTFFWEETLKMLKQLLTKVIQHAQKLGVTLQLCPSSRVR